jgi:hypothetical protein
MPENKKKSAAKLIGMPWDFASLFNEAIRTLPERPLMKRDYMYASEIGKDFATRYLKMHAHPMSNPPNDRSRQKFSMGHITEWIVGIILSVTGILKSKQMRGEVTLPGMLRVSGKMDFIAGGDIDWVAAKERVKEIRALFALSLDDMPPIIFHAVDRVFFRMEQMFTRVPLKEYIIEIKSCASFISKRLMDTQTPMPDHIMQAFHYTLANNMDSLLIYICKDDSMCHQFEITKSKSLLKTYTDDVQKMTAYYNASGRNYLKNIPDKAPEVFFDLPSFTFLKNSQVAYSPYLTMLYGHKDFDEFKYKWQYKVTAWNRVMKRCIRDDNMTPANLTIIKEATKLFPEWDKYVTMAKKAGVFVKKQEDEDE